MVFNDRQSTRLHGFDYSKAGAYFVTLCTWRKEEVFGRVEGNGVHLSPEGKIVLEEWLASFAIRQELRRDTFAVMPNHFHAIVWLGHGHRSSLGRAVGGFKSAATKRINALNDTPGRPLWQRNYHDRLIRHDQELQRVRRYIQDNPRKWDHDPNHPGHPQR